MLVYLAIGLVAGIVAGFFGIGGGIIMVPALLWAFHLTQHEAQGLSLATLVLPIGILGALTYYRAHAFSLKPVPFLAIGIMLGACLGGLLAQYVPARNLRMSFGGLMIVAGVKLILGK